MNIQQLVLLGHATRDGEMLESKSGKKFEKFGLAVNRYMGKDKEAQPTFYDVVSFGVKGEKVAERIKKGDLVTVVGRPEAQAYLSKEGEAKATLKVIAEKWQVVK